MFNNNRLNNMRPQLLAQALQRRGNANGMFLPQKPGMAVGVNQNVPSGQVGQTNPPIPVGLMRTEDEQPSTSGPQNPMNAFGRTLTPNQPNPQFGFSPQISGAKIGY